MRRTPEDNTKLFDEWAQTYDQDLAQSAGPLTGYAGSVSLARSLLSIPPAATLLDIGIGTGEFAASVALNDTRVHGVDISPEMLKRSQERNPSWDLRLGSFEDIPYPSKTFDVIISSFAFHEVDPAHRQQALRDVEQRLRAGAHVCILDIMFVSPSALQSARREIEPYWDSSEEYPMIPQVDEQLRTAGFVDISWIQSGPYHWIVRAQTQHNDIQNT